MAELPDLGKHCSKENCNQLDFLPFQCIHCKLTFCKDHFPVSHHKCSDAPDNNISDANAVKSPSLYRCSFTDCSAGELTPIICAECKGQFCLKHRHQVDHNCSKYEAPKDSMAKTREHIASLAVMQQKASVVPKKPRNAKSQRMAAKVQLMKLKMKSVGNKSLPQDEKVFFQILLPKTIERRTENVFVSGKWSMGKVIDTVADLCKVPNKNNVATEKKLRLFRYQDGENITCQLEAILNDLKKAEEVFNGDCLVLEFVEDGDTSSIDTTVYAKM